MQANVKRSRSRGFTLIELLVVIAIIAILAAILFPVFAQAREKARQAQCVSNCKQIGTGLMMYVQDYDECYPHAQWYEVQDPNGGGQGQHTWAMDIAPYIKSGDLFGTGGVYTCPSFPTKSQSYNVGINSSVSEDCYGPCVKPVTSLSRLERPADLALVLDKGQNSYPWSWEMFLPDDWAWAAGHDNAWSQYPDGVWRPNRNAQGWKYGATADTDPAINNQWPGWPNPAIMPRYRHSGTCDVVFGDGHVKSMPRGRLNWEDNIYEPAPSLFP